MSSETTPEDIRRFVNNILDDSLVNRAERPDTDAMSDDMSRHEVAARLEASEARVESAMAGMKSEMSALRSDVMAAISGIRADHAKDQVAATRWQVGLIAVILLGAATTTATVIVRTAPQRAATVQPIVIPTPPTAAPLPAGD